MRKFALAAASTVALAGLSLPAASASAAVRPNDPTNCNPGVSGAPGISSFTLHVNGNACSDPIKAYVVCIIAGKTGSPIYGPAIVLGTSKASCPSLQTVYQYGYSIEYSPNSWSNILMGYAQ